LLPPRGFLNHGMTGFAAHFEEEWPNRILALVFAYSISVADSTLCTLFYVIFGRDPRLTQEDKLVEITNRILRGEVKLKFAVDVNHVYEVKWNSNV
jgi:hypothetical protein